MIFPAQHVSIAIEKKPEAVYQFMAEPKNMPKWAAGLAKAELTKKTDRTWIANSPMGKVEVTFSPENKFGVVDHDVKLPNGEVNHNPLRILKNGDGSEVVFTLYRLKGVTDADYAKDKAHIEADLKKLKSILEQR